MHGQLSVGSLPAEGWYVWARGVTTITDAAGHFEIRTTAGPAIVRFTRRLPNGGELRIRRLHRLVAGKTATQVSIRTGSVALRRLPDSEPATDPRTPHGYALVWKDQAQGSIHYLFDPDPQGTHRVDALPEGTVELRRRNGAAEEPESWPLIAELEIVAGKRRGLSVPRD